jgi:class 3 adenylate cyclase/tetratricopeptide (TPR) repeat protein
MRCVTCGVELIPEKRFCHECGTAVGSQCAGCGATLEATYRFCPDCGMQVGAEPAAGAPETRRRDEVARTRPPRGGTGPHAVAAAAPLDGERKQVTVLFCDLVGSVAIAERLDPEEYHDLIEDYLDVAFPEIYRREGVVNVLAGDGVMALFGAPVAHEDSPVRAVRAALAIRDALTPLDARLRDRHGVSLQVRIGVNTGPVVVGPMGGDQKMDYTAIGDTTNLASRLQSLAPPGEILISESTHRLVRGFFAVEATGPLGVRGKSAPVSAYRVLDWRGETTKLDVAAQRGLTPFVGREGELARLIEAFARVEEGAQAVMIVGDAGSGKSRLLYELGTRLRERDVALFEGCCASMMQGLPYFPFFNLMARWFDLDWDEEVEASCGKVARRLGKPYEEIESEYPVLCRFLSLPIEQLADQPAAELRRETFDVVARLVLAEADVRPVVLVMEDLHWIDEPSREFLEELARRIAGSRVLLVTTQRPDVVVPWRVPMAASQIVLRPLPDDAVGAVVRSAAGAPLGREVEDLIVTRAGGSPFFAEELVRTLVEERHLVPGPGGVLEPARPLAELPIPGTIQEVVAARLDSLGPVTKRVVQVAAVLGRQFRSRQLAALLAGDGIDVQGQLAELERRGLVHRKTVLSIDEFRFGESLTQEVAYESLLLRQRRQLHERIGELLEAEPAGPGGEGAALRAHHYARSDNHAKAVAALLDAGREAEQVPSYGAAADHYRQAWQLAETVLGEREDGSHHRSALEAALGLARLEVFFGVADVEEADRAARRALDLAGLLGDREKLATTTYFLGILATMRPHGDVSGGLALAERGVALAEEAGLTSLATGLMRGLCIHYAADGRLALARERIDEVLEALERDGHRERATPIYLSSCWVRDFLLYAQDRLDEALVGARQSFALAQQANNFTMRSALCSVFAPVHYLRGEYAEAKRWADLALEIGEAIANANVYLTGGTLGLAARLQLGEPVDAGEYIERIEAGLRAAGTMQLNVRFIGEALLAAGEIEQADRLTAQLVASTGGRLRQALALVARADVLARLGRFEEATRRYAEACTLAEAVGSRSTLAAALIGTAEVAVAEGEAPADVERAAELCREVGLHHYRPRIERLLAVANGTVRATGSDA